MSLHHNLMSFSNDILLIREVSTVETRGLLKFHVNIKCKEGRYSVVGITTCCGLDGLGFESWCMQDNDFFFFSTLVQTVPRFIQPPERWVPGLYTGN